MAPKYNAFATFIKHHQQQEKSKGKRTSFKELADKLSDTWKSMTVEEKNKYKILSGKSKKDEKKNEHLLNNFDHNWKSDVEKIFESMNKTELMNRKFILVHVNCHIDLEEQYYFPAEIAALEFNLADGVTRRYYQIIGISDIYPLGSAAQMKRYATHHHQIQCFDKFGDGNYFKTIMKFLHFLTNGSEDSINNLSTLTSNMPYMFTIESELGMDMTKMKNGLERLFATALPKYAEHAKSVFKIGCIEELFNQIITKLNIEHPKAVQKILESHINGDGIGCMYHHSRDIEHKCSKARILQWLSNICKYVNQFTNIRIIPGKHVPALLNDGSRVMFDSPDEVQSITDDDNIMIDNFDFLQLHDNDMRFDYKPAGNLESTTSSSILDASGNQVESNNSDIKF